MVDMHNRSLVFEDNRLIRDLVGSQNQNLQHIESLLDVSIANRGNEVMIKGAADKVQQAEQVLQNLWDRLGRGFDVTSQDVDAAIRFSNRAEPPSPNTDPHPQQNHKEQNKKMNKIAPETDGLKTPKKIISPRSPLQQTYLKTMHDKDMVFATGPGGTGKTYLGVAYGVKLFLEGKVERMIFTRPAVEAGENLGFLPGDMREKIDPYLRPIYDALFDVMYADKVAKKIEDGEIEIAPLAFMRGRTLKNAFVLLDEAQNTTPVQMKMFLTRMGEGTKMVITGDPSQIDLPVPRHGLTPESGLVEALDILQGVDDIGLINFTSQDVVRHRLVGKIIDAYDQQ